MAEIKVERSGDGGRSWLPWIVGLLVLALVIWGVTQVFDGDDAERPAAEAADTVSALFPAAGTVQVRTGERVFLPIQDV